MYNLQFYSGEFEINKTYNNQKNNMRVLPLHLNYKSRWVKWWKFSRIKFSGNANLQLNLNISTQESELTFSIHVVTDTFLNEESESGAEILEQNVNDHRTQNPGLL